MMSDESTRPVSSIREDDMTQDQLALPTSQRISVTTRYGRITGGRVKNGVQVFMNVPYGLDGPRFTDPQPLPDDYRFPYQDYTKDRFYAPPPEVYPPDEDRRNSVGLGEPSESPFFANIYIPSTHQLGFDAPTLPVKVFIHGGFLQGGSPSSTGATQQFFAAEHWNEIRVLLGYRLGVLGFLAAKSPHLEGNWGFKDVWLGLEWIQRNIHSFGGDPTNVHLSGQSAGAHVVHNLLHRAARLAPIQSPFLTATLYSNSLFEDPFSLDNHQAQFERLCQACGVDETGHDALKQLQDRKRIPLETLFQHARNLGLMNSFVPASGGWLGDGMMKYQESGAMAKDLLRAGVRCIIVGDVHDESEGYKGAHEVRSEREILDNLSRWNRRDVVEKMYREWEPLPENVTQEQCQDRLGECLSANRVYLPVRLLANDMFRGGMPVIRYTIQSVARNMNTNGLVPHGSDLTYHFFRLSILTEAEMQQTLLFYTELQATIDAALRKDGSFHQQPLRTVLAWEKDGRIRWREDERWSRIQLLWEIVRPDAYAPWTR